MRLSTSSLFGAPPAEYIRTDLKATSRGAGVKTALADTRALRATGLAVAREAMTAVRIKVVRNMIAIEILAQLSGMRKYVYMKGSSIG